MAKEVEGKILNINIGKTKKRLAEIGATLAEESLQRRYVFDVIPKQPGKWLRLRTNGKTTTLTLKHITSDQIGDTDEIEVAVQDFDKMLQIIEGAGLKNTGYQENRRTCFKFEDAEIVIDEWPMLEPYLEIEAKSKEEVVSIAKKLGYKDNDIVGFNTVKIYESIGIDIHKIKKLKF